MSFLREVGFQGEALRDLVRFYSGQGRELLREVEKLPSLRLRSLVFHGMGTSEAVPTLVRDYLGAKTAYPVVLWEAGELLHFGMDGVRDDDVVIGVSQSGESIETRKIAELLRYHRHVISVTNDAGSSMARWSTLNLPMLAGEEASISNKTYTNSMAVLLLFSRALAGADWESDLLPRFERLADEMDSFLANRRHEIEAAAAFLGSATSIRFVARGPAMVAARQAALTFQEGVHISTSALPGGSMRHGPFEAVGPGHHAVLLAPDGDGGDLVRKMAVEMAELGSTVLLFTSAGVPESENLMPVRVPEGDPELFPFACAVPQELLLERMAADRGVVAGIFTRGNKITSVE